MVRLYELVEFIGGTSLPQLKRKMLKRLECLLLLLLAGPARHVSAKFSCDGVWLRDTSTCRKEDLNGVFDAKVTDCDSNGYLYKLQGCTDRESADIVNGHDDYDGPDIRCSWSGLYRSYRLRFSYRADCDETPPIALVRRPVRTVVLGMVVATATVNASALLDGAGQTARPTSTSALRQTAATANAKIFSTNLNVSALLDGKVLIARSQVDA